jgi:hypothetical protein
MSEPNPPTESEGQTAMIDTMTGVGSHHALPVSGSGHEKGDLAIRFRKLAEKWKRETGMESLAVFKYLHPAYQEIIGMGKAALPFIFEELKRKPGHWTWALQYIVGSDENPVRQGANLRQALEDWMTWGKAHGYA